MIDAGVMEFFVILHIGSWLSEIKISSYEDYIKNYNGKRCSDFIVS